MRRDNVWVHHNTLLESFNPRAYVRRDTVAESITVIQTGFNPRAYVRRDGGNGVNADPQFKFQSTRLREARQYCFLI